MSEINLDILCANKKAGFDYQERRHDEWTENYTLYRDKVITDRILQRQTVNIPLMKQTVRTLLKDVDDMPVLYFENLDNDKGAEQFKNEYWNLMVEENNMSVQDIVDKKQVFLYGRSFDQWQIVDGKIKMTIQDPFDILVSPYTDPVDLNSSDFLIHQHIFTPLKEIEKNEDYDKSKVAELVNFHESELGVSRAQSNRQSLVEKNKRLSDMGYDQVDNPEVGEAIVELCLHFVWEEEEDGDGREIVMYVEADDEVILMRKRLEEVIGETKDHFWRYNYPYNSWADDVERQDFWSDGVADITRQPNKVLNAWFSQLVENRTLRNFGMNYYNSLTEGFHPQTFKAKPFGWYGMPGNPKDIVQRVDIPELSESLDEMQFVMTINENATGATSTQQGNIQERQVTLGEVQLALGEAKERIQGMSKFYTPVWKRRGLMFTKLIEANPDALDAAKIYKKGKNSDKLYGREISPKDWMTESGYQCKVWSQEEKNTQDTNNLQKIAYAKQIMPGNQKLDEVYKRKVLEFANMSPQEINDVMEADQQMRLNAMGQMGMQQQPMQQQPAQQQVNPNQGAVANELAPA